MKLTKSQLKEIIREELKLTEINLQKVKKLVKKFKIPVVKYKKGQLAPNDVVVKTKGGRLETDKKAIDIFDKSGHHLETYDLDPKDLDKAFQHLKKISEGKLNENYNKVWNNWVSALDNFEKATVNLAKYNSKVTADKVDERIILQNFKKYINPFYNLMKSWKKGKK
jgi:hypothetical protein